MITQKQISEFSPEVIALDQTKPESLRDLETHAGKISRQFMREVIAQWLKACQDPEPPLQTKCRECGSLANYVSLRSAFVSTQFGLVRYQRAYYVCPHCHNATCPLDERLNPIESLARLREKIASGKSLPVAEMAKDWGLGSLKRTKVSAFPGQDAPQSPRSSN